jgi:type IV fimbrial biogenesis protein FimT
MRTTIAHGLTLTEVLASLAIAGIIAGLAAPSFVSTLARTRLEGAVNGLGMDLQYARSEAIRRRTTTTLTVAAGGGSYDVSYTLPSTNALVVLKTVPMPADVTLTATAPVVFDPLRGIAASQTFTGASSKATAQLQILTNANGRVQLCSPSGSFNGYSTC